MTDWLHDLRVYGLKCVPYCTALRSVLDLLDSLSKAVLKLIQIQDPREWWPRFVLYDVRERDPDRVAARRQNAEASSR